MNKSTTDIAFGTLVSCALALAAFSAAGADSRSKEDVIEIQGLRVDLHLLSSRQRKTMLPSLEKQIEVTMSATVPESVREFFKTVTIVADPAMLAAQTNGQYMQNDSPPYIRMKPIELPAERAILLHEYMHAFDHQVIKGSTPDIRLAYARAKNAEIYPAEYQSAAFLYNQQEFFANMATTFLLGKSERPPYSCSVIVKAQPRFVQYLTTLFGPHECADQNAR